MASLSLLAGRTLHQLIFKNVCLDNNSLYIDFVLWWIEIRMKNQLHSPVVRAVDPWFEEGSNIACSAE